MLRQAELDACVPARTIQHEDDLLGRTGSRLACKLRQLDFKDGDADGRGQMKEGASGGGMDEANQIAPSEAMLDGSNGSLANRRPDLAEQRLQANAVFVGGPQLDGRLRVCVGDGPYERTKLFLKSSCCSALARA